jgi:ABC-type sugar transport system substrate-binding protein
VSCYNTTNPYFAPTKAGTEDAGGELGIETTWTGSPNGTTTDQISQFKDLVNSGYQAIVVIPGEPDPWVAPINEAVAQGVIVCTANSDAPNSKRELYFGQDLYSAAVIQAQMLAKLAGNHGTVAMTNCAPGLLALDQRIAGAKHGITGAGMSVVGVYNTNPSDPASELSTIGDILKAHPNLTALMPLCGPDTAAAAQVKQQISGKFPIVGTDLLSQTLSYIKSGVVQGTVGQQPYLQSYLPVMYCYQRVVLQAPQLQLPGGNYYMSNEIVTAKNVDSYIARYSRF